MALRVEGYAIYIMAVLFILLAAWLINRIFFSKKVYSVKIPLQTVSAFRIPYKTLSDLQELSTKYNIEFARLVTLYSIDNDFFPSKTSAPSLEEIEQKYIKTYDKLADKYQESAVSEYYKILKNIFDDIQYFPIAHGYEQDGQLPYMYGDGWGDLRSYGGEREHLGTDIMDRENIRGRIPVVSMTAGVVENIGWNKLGGYRIGIRSNTGNYYYYAHFESFAPNLTQDTPITAGQLLGYMGDTGYGSKEGTTGQFAVHLHVGISPNTKLSRSEFWINPYPFLRLVENNKSRQEWRNP